MAKIMTQLDILSKNVMGVGTHGVNAVGVRGANPEEMKFEAMYDEEVNFLANQGGGYRSNYPRQGVNAIRTFRAAHEIDQMIAANLAAEAKAEANNEDQNNNTPGTIVSL
uniref:Uncharacterized protein n=1 Tax=Solanum tuberosum TaxID=4113 RepID=M1DVH2_SOLTU